MGVRHNVTCRLPKNFKKKKKEGEKVERLVDTCKGGKHGAFSVDNFCSFRGQHKCSLQYMSCKGSSSQLCSPRKQAFENCKKFTKDNQKAKAVTHNTEFIVLDDRPFS